jgi:TolB-like protein/DNA-binding winged helix-turn-helix (wHTH) protein/Flp pilus assembly protein TadD
MQPPLTPANGTAPPRFRVADLEVDIGKAEVTREGEKIALPKLSLDLLCALIKAAPAIVTNEELLQQVWPGLLVSAESVAQRVKLLRGAIGDDSQQPRYILGVRGRGYRLIPAVERLTEPKLPASAATSLSINTPSATIPGPTSETPKLKRSSRRLSRVVIAAAVLIALGAAIALGLRFWTVNRGAVQAPTVADSATRATAEPTAAAFNPPPHSIAVLPFVNLSGDKEQEYFSDGLTEELLNSLTEINELQVAARTSSFYFKGKDVDLDTVAHKLNVGAVLEGSVRRSAHTIRITAQLNNTVTGFHLWSKTYDRDLGDVLKLQTEIATAVAGALKVKLLGDVAAKIELGGSRNPQAFDAYLRAAKHTAGVVEFAEDWQPALDAYTEAIRLDPAYALAFAGRSLAFTAYGELAAYGTAAIRDSFAKAEADARKALALAPNLADGHLALANVLAIGSQDFVQAMREFDRALALGPNSARTLSDYGRFMVFMGRAEEGFAAARRAVVLDPLNPLIHHRLGDTFYNGRHTADALGAYRDSIALQPDAPGVSAKIGLAYYTLGNLESARSSCETTPTHWLNQECRAVVYDRLGRHADAEAVLAEMKAANGDDAAYNYAQIYAQWGNAASALQWLDRAVRLRDTGLIILKVDPLMDPLHKEPRFQAIVRALKFPE